MTPFLPPSFLHFQMGLLLLPPLSSLSLCPLLAFAFFPFCGLSWQPLLAAVGPGSFLFPSHFPASPSPPPSFPLATCPCFPTLFLCAACLSLLSLHFFLKRSSLKRSPGALLKFLACSLSPWRMALASCPVHQSLKPRRMPSSLSQGQTECHLATQLVVVGQCGPLGSGHCPKGQIHVTQTSQELFLMHGPPSVPPVSALKYSKLLALVQ